MNFIELITINAKYCLISTFVSILIVFVGRLGRRYLAFERKHRQTGCHRATRYPHIRFRFGYDLYRRRKDALRDGKLHALYTTDFNRLGKTWEECVFGKHTINTMDAANHQYIHATGFENFGKAMARRGDGGPILGTGIFVNEGARWRHSRGIIKPVFARSELNDVTLASKHVDRFLAALPTDGSTFDVQPMLKRLFLDLSTELLIGQSIDSQTADGGQDAEDLLRAWDESLLGWNKRRQSGILAIKYHFDKSWPKAYRQVYAFFDQHVQRALETTQEADSSEKCKQNLDNSLDDSHRYVLLYEMAKHIRDPVQLRFEVMNVFLPSRDTTALLAANTFFQLARHPSWWKKLRDEASGLGFDPNNNNCFTFELLKNLLTFRNVIYETLRTIGPAGRVFRTARIDTTLPSGGGSDGKSPVFVPAGTTVCSLTYHIHHDPDIWGPDADEFNPDRWTGRKAAWEFVPFLGGPRICPAQQQVITQTTFLLLKAVLAFRAIQNRDPVKEYVEFQRMTIESRNGVKIALQP